jgi:ribose transport system permease protein
MKLDTIGITGIGKSVPKEVLVLAAVTAALVIMGRIINERFLVPMNLANILTRSALLGFVAIGQTLVVISGDNGLDLSAGGLMSLSAILVYTITNGRDAWFAPALAAALSVGAAFGFCNAIGIVYAKIPALVMTLAVSNLLTSVQQLFTGGNPAGAPSPLSVRIATTKALPFLPWLAVVWAAVIVLIYVFMSRTSYSRQLYAAGSNQSAAFYAGVRVNRIRVLTYTLSGVLSGFAGFWLCAYNGVLYVNAGASYVMPSVAAVVIGGTSLAGGRGTYLGTAAGAIILTLINSQLVMLDTGEAGRFIMNGIILLALLAVYTRGSSIRQ